MALSPVSPGCDKGYQKRYKRAEAYPVGVTPCGINTLLLEATPSGAKESHGQDPRNRRKKERKTRKESHDSRPRATVVGSTHARDERTSGDASR